MEEREIEQVIKIVNGKVLTVNGVKDIVGFDEGVILLTTSNGKLTVEGKDLRIESLNKNGGELLINGKISGVYKSDAEQARHTFFSKIFRK